MNTARRFSWHSEQWRRIAAARMAGRLPHALLLAGAGGLGKAAFATRLSDSLVCTRPDGEGDACGVCAPCRLTRAGSHPDQKLVVPGEPGKMIKIDAIRDLTASSVLSAQEGGYRVFVIDPAEAMNRASANALLKTLEEPVSRTVLILVSSHPDRLAATIRSRCQVVKFAVPPIEEVRAWLAERADPASFEELLAISGGAPLRALQAQEEGWIEESRRLSGELATLKQRKANPLSIVEEWEKRPLTLLSESLKRCLSDLIKLASGLWDTTIYHPGLRGELQSLSEGIDLQLLYGFNDDLVRLDRESSHNLNVQMKLEYIANRWLQITRPGGR